MLPVDAIDEAWKRFGSNAASCRRFSAFSEEPLSVFRHDSGGHSFRFSGDVLIGVSNRTLYVVTS